MNSNIATKSESFLIDIRAEIRLLQKSRSNYIKQKFTFVISLLGIGSISISNIETSALLYIVPFIALSFDLYIIGEDFGIKRAGGFLKQSKSESPKNEQEWEEFVCKNRDPFSFLANPLLSSLVLFISSISIYTRNKIDLIYWIWFLANIIIFSILQVYARNLNRKIQTL